MEFIKREPLIILIGGKARSGKSTLAECLKINCQRNNKKVIISPYTKYLKYYIEQITGKKEDPDNKDRDLLQQMSSKIIKGDLGMTNFFIDRQIEDIDIYSYFADIIIVPDVRFPKEIEVLKKKYKYVVSIGIKRYDYISTLTNNQMNDITETSLDNYDYFDYRVDNKKDTNLEEVASNLIKEIAERKYGDE